MIDALYQDLVAFYGEKYFELRESGKVYEIEESHKDAELKKAKCVCNCPKWIEVKSECFLNDALSNHKGDARSKFKSFGLKKVCDGFCMTEQKGQFYVFLLELKSTFNIEPIDKARLQLYASTVNTKRLLGMLKHFPENTKVQTIILTRPVTTEDKKKIMNKVSQGDDKFKTLAKFLRKQEEKIHLKDYRLAEVPLKPEYLPTQLCVALRQSKVDARGVALETINLDDWI